MSGRLRILPHKSWHVWTTDNIEKVKRDERLHKEEIECSAKRSRDVKSEQLLVQLLDKDSTTIESDIEQHNNAPEDDVGTNYETNSHKDSVVPMKDVRINRHADNIEYKKEKADKELKQKRQEGSAPFQLVPDEFSKKNAPWYMAKKPHMTKGSGYRDYDNSMSITSAESQSTVVSSEAASVISSLLIPSSQRSKPQSNEHESVMSRGRKLSGPAAAAFRRRDSTRKEAADPMAHLLHKAGDDANANANAMSSLSSAVSLSASSSLVPPSSSRSRGQSVLTSALRSESRVTSACAHDRKRKHDHSRHQHQYNEYHSPVKNSDSGSSDTEAQSRHHKKRKHKEEKYHKHKKENRKRKDSKHKHIETNNPISSSISRDSSCNINSNSKSNTNKGSSSGHSDSVDMSVSSLQALRVKRLARERDAQLEAALLPSRR